MKLLSKQLTCFSTIETLVSVAICSMILFPIGVWIQHSSHLYYQQTKENSVRLDVLFLLEDIETHWMQFYYEPDAIRPKEGITEQALFFKTTDQRLVRYYSKGNEVGRDINYSTFQNLTQKVVKRYKVTRCYDGQYGQIQICIEDILGRKYNKLLCFQLPS